MKRPGVVLIQKAGPRGNGTRVEAGLFGETAIGVEQSASVVHDPDEVRQVIEKGSGRPNGVTQRRGRGERRESRHDGLPDEIGGNLFRRERSLGRVEFAGRIDFRFRINRGQGVYGRSKEVCSGNKMGWMSCHCRLRQTNR